MDKKPQPRKRTNNKLSSAALYALFVKPGDILFRHGEKVRGFSV